MVKNLVLMLGIVILLISILGCSGSNSNAETQQIDVADTSAGSPSAGQPQARDRTSGDVTPQKRTVEYADDQVESYVAEQERLYSHITALEACAGRKLTPADLSDPALVTCFAKVSEEVSNR